jgi:hypothetical protein
MRSPVNVVQAAAGASAWIPLDMQQRPFNVALMTSLSYNGNLTYTVQFTPDNPQVTVPCTITISGTTATVTFAKAHNLSAADSITVINSGDPGIDGTWAVASVPSATTLTYTVVSTVLTTALPPAQAVLMRVYPHDVMQTLTTRADGNFQFPCWAVRVNVTSYTAGSVELSVIQGHARG